MVWVLVVYEVEYCRVLKLRYQDKVHVMMNSRCEKGDRGMIDYKNK